MSNIYVIRYDNSITGGQGVLDNKFFTSKVDAKTYLENTLSKEDRQNNERIHKKFKNEIEDFYITQIVMYEIKKLEEF